MDPAHMAIILEFTALLLGNKSVTATNGLQLFAKYDRLFGLFFVDMKNQIARLSREYRCVTCQRNQRTFFDPGFR
jgi:hypothetical protein